MQIAPSVYWLSGRSVNVFLCQDEDGLTLIDTGMPGRQAQILEAIAKLGFRSSEVVRIIITHADIDHAGGAAAIQAETGATVYAGAETSALLCRCRSPKHMPWLAQFLMERFMSYSPCPEAAIETCQEGDVLPVLGELQVLATPGHTLGHHSFYSPTAGVLFAGDALQTRGGRLQVSPKFVTADRDAARRSAIRLLNLAPAHFACGHGPPMSDHSSDDLMILLNELRQN